MNNRVLLFRFAYYSLCLLLIVSCKPKNILEKIDNDFPNIQIPGIITSHEDAANFFVKNYWNNFLAKERLTGLRDKEDSAYTERLILGIDSIKFETAFGEYAAALYYMQPKEYNLVCTSIKKLFKIADSIAVSGDSTFLFKLMNLGEKYFYDPNSPVLNEELYLPVLEGILLAKAIGDLDKMQYEYQFNISSLNRVGTPAANFEYNRLISLNGDKGLFKQGSLYGIKADYTLLFFNNPDCPSCAEIGEKLKSSPAIGQLIENGKLKILAMYIDEELELWRNNKDVYPADWIYAYDNKYILRDNNLYGLRAIPSLYLLDRDKKVLLKDANMNKVTEYISSVVL